MTVKMILKEKGRSVVTVLGGHTMEEATRVLQEKRIGAAIVVDAAGRVVGVLSERDIVRAIATDGVASLSRPLREFMTREVHTCTPEDTLDSVMGKMTGRRIRHLPVMEAERLAGIISIGDVVKMKIAASEHEAEALKQYIVAG
ncbi:MAG: CBS domain-containing protein [Alphaproteobacteria bacterium]|nr:CBS domain-containing protein [Alphaproteobacteria bacterium]